MTGVRVGPTTAVKFRDVTQQADYEATHPRDHALPQCPDSFIANHAGDELQIYVVPIPPQHRQCGVERVWIVPDEEVERLTGAPPPWGRVIVCEHQVEID